MIPNAICESGHVGYVPDADLDICPDCNNSVVHRIGTPDAADAAHRTLLPLAVRLIDFSGRLRDSPAMQLDPAKTRQDIRGYLDTVRDALRNFERIALGVAPATEPPEADEVEPGDCSGWWDVPE